LRGILGVGLFLIFHKFGSQENLMVFEEGSKKATFGIVILSSIASFSFFKGI
jgi:hypothetical protein